MQFLRKYYIKIMLINNMTYTELSFLQTPTYYNDNVMNREEETYSSKAI